MLWPILGVALVGLAVPLILATFKPDTFRVQRTKTIKAPPEKIFPLLHDFHKWGSWSPWEKIEPEMTRKHSGAVSGTGAVYEWEGKKVGSGRMEIANTSAPRHLSIKLDFLKPWKASNIAEFNLEPSGDSTNVTWSMHGPSNYMSKVMTVFMSMDKMVGKDFEKGLTNMKSLAES